MFQVPSRVWMQLGGVMLVMLAPHLAKRSRWVCVKIETLASKMREHVSITIWRNRCWHISIILYHSHRDSWEHSTWVTPKTGRPKNQWWILVDHVHHVLIFATARTWAHIARTCAPIFHGLAYRTTGFGSNYSSCTHQTRRQKVPVTHGTSIGKCGMVYCQVWLPV